MAIDPGTRTARFLPQGRSYESVVRYIARGRTKQNVQSYCEATLYLTGKFYAMNIGAISPRD